MDRPNADAHTTRADSNNILRRIVSLQMYAPLACCLCLGMNPPACNPTLARLWVLGYWPKGTAAAGRQTPEAAAAAPVHVGGIVGCEYVGMCACGAVVWGMRRSIWTDGQNIYSALPLRGPAGFACLDRISMQGQLDSMQPPAAHIDTRSKRCNKESRISKTGMCHLYGRVGRAERGPNALFWMRGRGYATDTSTAPPAKGGP